MSAVQYVVCMRFLFNVLLTVTYLEGTFLHGKTVNMLKLQIQTEMVKLDVVICSIDWMLPMFHICICGAITGCLFRLWLKLSMSSQWLAV